MSLHLSHCNLRESLEVPKGSQATCSVSCGSWRGYGANAREIGPINISLTTADCLLQNVGFLTFNLSPKAISSIISIFS